MTKTNQLMWNPNDTLIYNFHDVSIYLLFSYDFLKSSIPFLFQIQLNLKVCYFISQLSIRWLLSIRQYPQGLYIYTSYASLRYTFSPGEVLPSLSGQSVYHIFLTDTLQDVIPFQISGQNLCHLSDIIVELVSDDH